MMIKDLTRKILSDGWTKLSLVTYSMKRRNGQWQSGLKREVYERGPAVAVLPYDKRRKTVLLVRQLRIPALLAGDNGDLLEVCAGVVDEGEQKDITVLREAEEELGYQLTDLEQVASAFVSPGYSSEKLSLFLASYTHLNKISHGGGLESEGEDIEIVELPFEKLLEEVNNNKIHDLKTLYLIQALMIRLKYCIK